MTYPFKFKNFTIEQDRCAMKIGTDGVLLGAWASLKHDPQAILDIGTGTGVIALMLAQRSGAELIDAIEINEDAYEQAVENFENSEWGDRLFCYHAEFEEFVEEMQEEQEYDLIISNPPFYDPRLPAAPPTEGENPIPKPRKIARFNDALPFDELLGGVSRLLSAEGKFSVIIPRQEEESFLQLAQNFKLFPQRVTHVKGNPETAEKRSLLELGFHQKQFEPQTLIIENSRHNYTQEYSSLVKDFYLKM